MNVIAEAVSHLARGHVIAYATEAVFGLGCDPDNVQAVMRLLNIKQRPIEKGVILIAGSWEQLLPYVDLARLPEEKLLQAQASWPGPFTWVMPASNTTPKWLTGQFDSIAVRVSAHPQVKELCLAWGKALVSTSANLSGEAPCRSEQDVETQLGGRVDFIVPGEVGGAVNPSEIRDVLTGKLLRPA
jgi:Putative translation factor (SUA5)